MNDDPQDPVERLLDACLAAPSDQWQAAIDAARAAQALRDNLRRRKAQARARAEDGHLDGQNPAPTSAADETR